MDLLRALINPRADEADLFSGQRLGGFLACFLAARTTGSRFAMRMSVAGLGRFTGFFAAATRCAGTALSARAALTGFGRHGRFGIDAGDGSDEGALGAIADDQNRAVFAALQYIFKGVETEIAFVALRAMAASAGRFKQRLDIGGKSDALLGRSRRERGWPGRGLGSIRRGRRRFGAKDGAAGDEEPGGKQGSSELGIHVWDLICRGVYR